MNFQEIVNNQREYFLNKKCQNLSSRKETLKNLKNAVLSNVDNLTEAVYKDLRRHTDNTYILEIASVLQEIDYFLSNLDEWSKDEHVQLTHMTALDTAFIKKQPKGVVLIIAPWNYPISMVLLPLIPCIAAGNTAVIKPSEMAPATSEVFYTLFTKYFSSNEIYVVQGGIPETTELLKCKFDHIFYTGCPPVAKIIMKAAAENLTPVTLELGGKCPVFVDKDADINITGKRVAWGKWLNCGQTCLAPDYILTTEDVKPKLVASLKNALFEFYGENVQLSKDYSRIINNRHWNRISNLLKNTKGNILVQEGTPDENDLFIPPTIIEVSKDDTFMEDEIFGPILPIITVSNIDEAIEYIKNGERPLASYIFTRSKTSCERFLNDVISGGCTINDVIMHLTVDTLPFGGIGKSGMGRYRGKFGFDTFTHGKAVLKKGFFLESLMKMRYPPMNIKKFNNLKYLQSFRFPIPLCIPWFSIISVIGAFLVGYFASML
ncbi:Aldehyde dehydrogenase NAD(P)-dependent family and Aldehyde dehydrogenase domain and Aldehyde/histidinol dehydrogenase domain and Aldehyde dehydrogenase, N-terminal domain and Aldehyde dehydrogenase, C-terminal domain-containing protein [Strongyloides ratti]|uniref:Aldehyde dehydrogenase n=1 Tax=Strongyloides ratti TaxID=34506 RepID=A0A090MWB7_STRRB|nr:Aldehyde dehydrogenase NAD(P)-dependent family and Aldehyde dehydrogenase domain and Aldehyde/histidinol dehydrogenase domain and Aldehyde dehydrogenase, N-terminal domain and Aldehyde dehydrogenase, C-terminal domain-containing protein [Strongyloides ratti]CEF63604.1 Aldehyde dehydrogenase NAD(P)-dependent family and Aldehyde dehydrogenase domain and Aldehyde/histidinol dehydrogenase domain and Aldehyde dehydrogenase, N-terminal domain and Aldehyde dehydrogenase, C-terminal domain-containing p